MKSQIIVKFLDCSILSLCSVVVYHKCYMLSNQQITACVNKMREYVYIPGLSQIESCVLFPGNFSGNPSTLHLFSTKLLHHWHVHNFFYLSLRQKLFKSILLCQWFAVIRLHIEILFFATYGFTLIRIFYHPCIRGDDWNKRKKYYFSKHERYFGGDICGYRVADFVSFGDPVTYRQFPP